MSEECRLHEVVGRSPAFGRTTVTIRCPFCGCDTEACLWSLSGSGKRCDCGAVHRGRGMTTKVAR